MIRALAVSLLLSSLAACQSSPDAPIAHDDSCCNTLAPQVVPWDGQPLPPGQGDTAALYLYDSLSDPTHTWAYRFDGDQLIAIYDLKPASKATFIASFMLVCPKQTSQLRAAASTIDVVCQVAGGTHTMTMCQKHIAANPTTSELDCMSAYLMYVNKATKAAQIEVLDQFTSGELCPVQ